MGVQVTSVFLYVDDVVKSMEFYNEIVGAEIAQVHAEEEDGPVTLAILKLGDFSIMLHPNEEQEETDIFTPTPKRGLGIHLQIKVDDIDKFYTHCVDEGALLSLSGEPVDQEWGWREFALKDPDGYVWSVYQDKTGGQWT